MLPCTMRPAELTSMRSRHASGVLAGRGRRCAPSSPGPSQSPGLTSIALRDRWHPRKPDRPMRQIPAAVEAAAAPIRFAPGVATGGLARAIATALIALVTGSPQASNPTNCQAPGRSWPDRWASLPSQTVTWPAARVPGTRSPTRAIAAYASMASWAARSAGYTRFPGA